MSKVVTVIREKKIHAPFSANLVIFSPRQPSSRCPEGARWDVARADMTPRSHQPRGQMAFAGVWKKAAVQSRLLSARRRRSGKPAEVG